MTISIQQPSKDCSRCVAYWAKKIRDQGNIIDSCTNIIKTLKMELEERDREIWMLKQDGIQN